MLFILFDSVQCACSNMPTAVAQVMEDVSQHTLKENLTALGDCMTDNVENTQMGYEPKLGKQGKFI